MAKVFVSYRRSDTQHGAGRLYDYLIRSGKFDSVFIDVAEIRSGADFTSDLADAISSSDIVLALIGTAWLSAPDGQDAKPRLFSSEDYVRREIEGALNSGKIVVPVLLDGASMPGAGDLPPSLEPLTRLNAAHILHRTFARDVDQLVSELARCSAVPALPISSQTASARVFRHGWIPY